MLNEWRDSPAVAPEEEPDTNGDTPMPDDERQPGLTSEPLRYTLVTASGAQIAVSQFTGLSETKNSAGESQGLSEYQTGLFRITGTISADQLAHIEQIEEHVVEFARQKGFQMVNSQDTETFEATFNWLDNPDTEQFDPDHMTVGQFRAEDGTRTVQIVVVDLFDDATDEQQQAINDIYGECVAQVFLLLGMA